MIANPISTCTTTSTASSQPVDTVSGKGKTHGIANTALSDATKAENAANTSRSATSTDIVIPVPRTRANVDTAKKIIDYFKQNDIPITQENLQQFLQSLVTTAKTNDPELSAQLADPAPPDGDLPPIDAPTPPSFLYGVPTNVDPSIEMFAGLIALVLQMMEASTALKSTNAELIVSAAKFQSDEIVKQGNLEVTSAWVSGITAAATAGAGAWSSIRGAHTGVTGSSHHDVWKNHEQAGMDKIRFKDGLAGTQAIEKQNMLANPDRDLWSGHHPDGANAPAWYDDQGSHLENLNNRHAFETTQAADAVRFHDNELVNTAHPQSNLANFIPDKAEAIANQISGQRGQAIGILLAQTVSHVTKGGVDGSFKAAESAAQADATEYAASGTLGNSLMDSSSQSKGQDDSLVIAILNMLKSYIDNKTSTHDTMKI